MSDQPKKSTFLRTLAIVRAAKQREKMQQAEIRRMERLLHDKGEQCTKLADTIKRTVTAHATVAPWQDRITLCIDIDLRTANLHGDDVLIAAMAQLSYAVNKEIQKHRR